MDDPVILLDTPGQSDDVVTLDKVKPGGIFRLNPAEEGTFVISSQSSDGRMFPYTVKTCCAGDEK